MTHLFRFFSLNYIISITSFKLSLLVQNHIQIQKYFQNLRGRSYDSLFFLLQFFYCCFFPLECECMAVIHDQDISISIFLSESSFLFFSDLSSFSSTLVQITITQTVASNLIRHNKILFSRNACWTRSTNWKKYRKNTNQTQTEFAKLYT